jgi:signal transduction histidine kinase
MYNEINHLSRLGTSLNLLTKVEHGEFNDAKLIKTKDEIFKQVESLSELAELKGLKFEIDLSESHSLYIDPNLFNIIISNLLSNSINYATNDGPIKLITNQDGLRISNHGKPLNFSEEKIFSRLSKKSGSNSSVGLGLAIVYKICQTSGLEIRYNYSENEHSFFIS